MGLGAEGRRPSEASVNLKLEAIIKLNADLCHTFCEHHNLIRVSRDIASFVFGEERG